MAQESSIVLILATWPSQTWTWPSYPVMVALSLRDTGLFLPEYTDLSL